jgi:hypothetical protein
MGHHDFSFAIMPHTGRLVESDVVRDALRFTNPPVRESPVGFRSCSCCRR